MGRRARRTPPARLATTRPHHPRSGCGAGSPAGAWSHAFGGGAHFAQLHVWDHSPLAVEFTAGAAQNNFPNSPSPPPLRLKLQGDEPIGLLLISHVLNELNPRPAPARRPCRSGRIRDLGRAGHARASAGNSARFARACAPNSPSSRPAPTPVPVASSPAEHERDWCHFFAPPPSEIFATPDWVKFGQRAGIDLRSLPYAFRARPHSLSSSDGSLPHHRPTRAFQALRPLPQL